MQYDEQTLLRLRDIANRIRLMGLEMVYQSRSGHLGGAFSMAEILAVLYFHTMRIDPQQPHWAQRDRLVLSKGHGTVALYPALSLRGFFPEAELATFRRMDSRLSGHAEIHVPGVDMSTGSLGQGLSAAVGMALSARIHQQDYRTYAICGDGEIEEGQIWEAAMFAAHYKLRCLTLIVDHNRLQLDGPVKDVMDLKDIGAKFTAFGWHTVRVDGHSVGALLDALREAQAQTGQPTVIIADTIKGKGVSFMENQVQYHGHIPDEAQFVQAFEELRCVCARKVMANG